MQYTISAFDRLPCEAETFIINGINADVDDFGEVTIEHGEGRYSCYIDFESKHSTEEVLSKYNIDGTEYEEIQDKLNNVFFGSCGCCI